MIVSWILTDVLQYGCLQRQSPLQEMHRTHPLPSVYRHWCLQACFSPFFFFSFAPLSVNCCVLFLSFLLYISSQAATILAAGPNCAVELLESAVCFKNTFHLSISVLNRNYSIPNGANFQYTAFYLFLTSINWSFSICL